MDEMYERLIEKLRDDTMWKNCEFDFIYSYMHEAADAIEKLQKITTHYEEESKGWWLAACDAKEERERLKEQLDNAEIENIKLKEEFAKYRGKNRWIPVTERLPERAFKEILPKYPYSIWMWISINDDMWLGRYNVEEKEWYDDFGEVITGVTHWMPTPEPPEDGEA